MAGIADEDGNVEIRDWLRAMHPDDRPAYLAIGQKRMADDSPYRIEYRLTHPVTGRTRNMLESGWVTIDRATGERHLDCYLIDITSQKRIETQLKSSEQRFREFASLAGDWYFEADRDLNITYLSEGFETISGMSTDLFLGVSWEKITRNAIATMQEKDHAPWLDLLEAWKTGRPTRDHRMLFRFASGIDRTISTSGEAMLDGDGNRVGYRGVAKDVSNLIGAEERAIEERRRAEAANRAKSEFIANMSHELRTPLNAIIGFAGVMEQQMFGPIENDRYRSYAGDVSASGQHLLSLVNDILDLSRIEADRHSYDPEWLDLEDEIERVCVLFREEPGGRTLSPECGSEGGRVWADRLAFRQVLINLVGNAIKFTPDDCHIRIVGAGADDGASLSVVDNGSGMSAADAELALEPFGRAASSEIAGGTGLGLPITRKLVEMHGGELELDTAPGAGCSVRATFPTPNVKAKPGPMRLRSQAC